jgi:hypothetical protein
MSDIMSANQPAADEQPPTETVLFAAPSEYAGALDRALSMATSEIVVFDQDLQYGEWGTAARTAVLRRFLLSHRRSSLQIVVHETRFIEQFLPRLTLLLRDFSHKIQILRSAGNARNAWEGFTLVDKRHLVHRFHLDTMKGELSLYNPHKARELRGRYDEILGNTEPGVNATQLGL